MLRQLVFDPAGDHPPQRPRSVDAVVALFRKQVLGCVGHLDGDLLLDQVLAEPVQLQVHDLPYLLGGQALEHHHRVDAVEELRPEHPLQLFVDLLFGVLVTPLDFL